MSKSNQPLHRFATEEMERYSTIDLISELKRRYQVLSRPRMGCVVSGPPMSGVATQSSFIKKEWGVCSISRDDIFKSSPTGLAEAMNSLSDELASFRCRRGFVLSNFPQGREEATNFDNMLMKSHADKTDYKVILLTVPSGTDDARDKSIDELTRRATGELHHPSSGRVYNSNVQILSPQVPNVDDVTSEPLVCSNVGISSLRDRICSWWDTTENELRDYYANRVQKVDATNSPESVSLDISAFLMGTAK